VLPSPFVIAAYVQVRLIPQDVGRPRKRDFATLNLHLPACRSLGAGRDIFDQPEEIEFFHKLFDDPMDPSADPPK
jgi:hypothetical protein